MSFLTSTRIAAALAVVNILPILAQSDTQSDGEKFDNFVSSRPVRSSWIAFWILWIVWSLLTLLHYLTREKRDVADRSGGERGNRDATHKGGYAGRFGRGPKRAAEISRDLVLGLLSALVINALGRGTGKSVEIITWIFVAIAIIWLAVELFIDNRIVRALIGWVEFALLLTIFALSYAHGWSLLN